MPKRDPFAGGRGRERRQPSLEVLHGEEAGWPALPEHIAASVLDEEVVEPDDLVLRQHVEPPGESLGLAGEAIAPGRLPVEVPRLEQGVEPAEDPVSGPRSRLTGRE